MASSLRIAIASVLLLAAGNAAALGLGQIEVKSGRSQPLLAEIPIISTTPGELEALQARLASPETFRRVGLSPPSGIAADLQFSLGSDARGRPVIRVTTLRPVEQAVLNFLIEVDWGQGRLVREYSALVDVPRTASAPLQPAIQAPVLAAPSVVQRPQDAPAPPAGPVVAVPPRDPAPVRAQPVPLPPPPPPAPPAAPAPVAVEPLPAPAAIPAPVTSAPAPAAAPVTVAPAPAEYGPVKAGETLGQIVRKLDLPDGYSVDQALLALLRTNPDAFLGEDVNRIRRGAVLRVPGSSELGAVSADEAALVVRQQMQAWRQARRPVLQPEATTAVASRQPGAAAPAAAPASATAAPAASTPRPIPTPERTQARLEIVPPSAPGRATATRSGTSAGGEGSMLQQELRQRDEDLAARRAEIGELKERVAELEKMRQQQQELLALKDSELATVQQRLEAARKAAPGALADSAAQPAAGTAQAPAPQAAPEQAGNALPWMWGGLTVLGLALLGWLFTRRRRPTSTSPRRAFDSKSLAASLRPVAAGAAPGADGPMDGPMAARAEVVAEEAAATRSPGSDEPAGQDPRAAAAAVEPGSVPDAARVETPTWHAGRATPAAPQASPATVAEPRFVPVVDTGMPASAVPGPDSDQRLRLARAFQDIGDDDSARALLRELLDSADPAAREEAARVLRELG